MQPIEIAIICAIVMLVIAGVLIDYFNPSPDGPKATPGPFESGGDQQFIATDDLGAE